MSLTDEKKYEGEWCEADGCTFDVIMHDDDGHAWCRSHYPDACDCCELAGQAESVLISSEWDCPCHCHTEVRP